METIVTNDSPNETPSSLPSDPKTFFLGGLFFLAFLTAMHAASDIAMPIVLAFVLKLVLQPLQRLLEKLKLPRSLSALTVLLILVSLIVGLGSILAGPAASWAEKLPEGLPKLQDKLGYLSAPIENTQKFMTHAEDITHGIGPKVVPVAVQGTRLSDKIFLGARAFASELFTMVLVLFFLLVSGDTFLRRFVEVLPRFKDKRRAVDISQAIERDISIYLLTITTMNLLVGVATAIVMQSFGLGDAILWGTMAFLLNYVPIVGPIIGALIFLFAGLLVTDTTVQALLPAGLYLLIHLMEGTVITPLLLAKRFTLNPVLVILSLIFWYWMWGFAGAILAMPMLAITKIVCDRIHVLMALGHFLEG